MLHNVTTRQCAVETILLEEFFQKKKFSRALADPDRQTNDLTQTAHNAFQNVIFLNFTPVKDFVS